MLFIAGKNVSGTAIRIGKNGIADLDLYMKRYITANNKNSQTIAPAASIAFNFALFLLSSVRVSLVDSSVAIMRL
ncbi:hypothetical protein [Pedobacter soli]|uniref:Uncharacterized protein n=1 Tax=Pedobacter soli TaxID=390242 RepID=A0A1G6MWN1_9SPHI|nr:hypothetical protein [Pedobacter soli]SDC59943.1 hypothetical protein SAMN04488024_102485 [Pedobacter soli]